MMSGFEARTNKIPTSLGGVLTRARDIARRWIPAWRRIADPIATVIFVRHADYIPGTDPNPGLSTAGQARAQELRRVLANSSVQTIFVTSYARTQQTAAPLAATLGLSPNPVALTPAAVETHSAALESAIRELPSSSTVLVIGHTNTLPSLIKRLGGPHDVSLDASEFDWLFVLCGGRLIRLRY